MSGKEVYDYIVVGAGTAGCVVAARLSDTGKSVLLLEQGTDGTNENIQHADLDHLFALWQDENHISNYPMDPRKGAGDRWPELMRGRTVGGSGAVNVMIHTRANRSDLDGWAMRGNAGWAFSDLLPFYRMSESDPGGTSAWRGGFGPIKLTRPVQSVYAKALQEAAVELGFHGPDWDFNGSRQVGGAGQYQFAANVDGKRSSTASTYLAARKGAANLTVKSDTQVLRIAFTEREGKQVASGVIWRDSKTWLENTFEARERVIVCAGAIESPKLLMLSGIGPEQHLGDMGIARKHILEGVGQNLQDHVIAGVQFEGTQDVPKLKFLTEIGLFAQVSAHEQQYYYSPDGNPTIQFFMNAGIPERGFPWTPKNYFGIYPSLTRPDTRGSVRLAATDPRRPPVIQMDYLSDGDDMDILVNGIRLAMELAGTQSLSALNAGTVAIPVGSGLEIPSPKMQRKKLEAYLLRFARGLWHPACTCAMGPDPDTGAVVDSSLAVHGVEGLSVCDASVFPTMVCGNPNATVIAVAEKFAAELTGIMPEI